MIELRDRQVFSFPPFRAAVVGIPHPAIVAGEHDLCVGWIDPHVVHVAMHPAEAANHGEAFARVLANNQRAISLEYAVGILWIDNQVRKIKRPPHHPLALVSLLPRHAAIVGNKQGAIRRFHKSVNPLGIRRRDRHCKTAVRFHRETFIGLRRNLRPSVAAVCRPK